jgi:hypothetical protein
MEDFFTHIYYDSAGIACFYNAYPLFPALEGGAASGNTGTCFVMCNSNILNSILEKLPKLPNSFFILSEGEQVIIRSRLLPCYREPAHLLRRQHVLQKKRRQGSNCFAMRIASMGATLSCLSWGRSTSNPSLSRRNSKSPTVVRAYKPGL